MTDQSIIEATEQWLTRAVIGLNLCPFAKAVHTKKQIRYVVCHVDNKADLELALAQELALLAATPAHEVDTTLLIHPFVLTDFFDYNDFLSDTESLLTRMELDGEIQIASFHPDYQFADAPPDDISHYTNRSPYPILHLIREASIDRAVAAYPDAAVIYERNIETLNQLGLDGWRRIMSE